MDGRFLELSWQVKYPFLIKANGNQQLHVVGTFSLATSLSRPAVSNLSGLQAGMTQYESQVDN